MGGWYFYSFLTVTGVTIAIGGLSALLDGHAAAGQGGIAAGIALALLSEWQRWRAKRRP
jgi:hypothetical protein